MRKAIAALTAVAALALASPAFAIHDPFVPAGDCAPTDSNAVGHGTDGHPNQPNRGVSNTFALPMAAQANAQGSNHCHNA
jgi:hypothetical protein